MPGDKAGTGRAAASALKEQLKKHITGAMPAAATPTAAAAAAEVAGEKLGCLVAGSLVPDHVSVSTHLGRCASCSRCHCGRSSRINDINMRL